MVHSLIDVWTDGTRNVNNGETPLRQFLNSSDGPFDLPDFVQYWRGGNSRKAISELPRNIQNLARNLTGGVSPVSTAITASAVAINRPQVIIDVDYLGDAGERLRTTQGWNPTADDLIPIATSIRFIESIVVMDDGKVSVTGRRKRITPDSRGRLTQFKELYQDFDEMYGFHYMSDSVMEDWKHDLTVAICDEEEFISLPQWRLKWDSGQQDEMMAEIIKSPNLTEELLLKVNEFFSTHNSERINAPESDGKTAKFFQSKFLRKVDEFDRWTPNLINSELKSLVHSPESSKVSMWNYNNIIPTVKMFEISLIASTDELGIEWNLTRGDQQNIQQWILDNHGMNVPISLIHSYMTLPYINRLIKDKAQTKYRSRQREFVEYIDSLHEHEEGGVMPND